VDRDGKLVVPLVFENVRYWRGGYGVGIEPGIAGERILRADGSSLVDRYFDKVEIRGDGKLPRGRVGMTWYSIERDGRLIPDQIDGAPVVECPGGLTILQRGEIFEFVHDGKVIGQFDNGHFLQRDCPGPYSASRLGKYYIVLDSGRILGGRHGYDNMYSFSADFAAVQVGNKWGIIDRSGTFTVKPSFAKLRPDRKDTFAVGEGSETRWVDPKGKPVEKPTTGRASAGCGLPRRTAFSQRRGVLGPSRWQRKRRDRASLPSAFML
jgi:hypothetical protein